MVETSEWVGLSEAAKILGVSPATVRAWADRGHLPSQRTPGGHRRFRAAELTRWLEAQQHTTSVEAELLVQSAIGRARQEIGHGGFAEAPWFRNLDQETRTAMGLFGRHIMETLQRHLAQNSDNALAEAREWGIRYGKALRACDLKLSDAIDGFFAFNDFVMSAMLQVIEFRRDPNDRSDAVRKIYAFTRELILALIVAYDA